MRDSGCPAEDLVGPGAVDVARGVVLFLGLVVLHVGGLVLLGPAAAHDAEVDDVAQQDRVGRGQHDVDRVVVDLLDVGDAGDVDRHRALRLLDAAEAEHHVVGGEGRAVLELDTLAQLEAHLRGADEGPLGGQRRARPRTSRCSGSGPRRRASGSRWWSHGSANAGPASGCRSAPPSAGWRRAAAPAIASVVAATANKAFSLMGNSCLEKAAIVVGCARGADRISPQSAPHRGRAPCACRIAAPPNAPPLPALSCR